MRSIEPSRPESERRLDPTSPTGHFYLAGRRTSLLWFEIALTYRVPGSKKRPEGDAIALRGNETIRACARKRRSLWLQPVSRRQ